MIFGVVFSLPQYYMCYHMLFLCVITYYAYIILYVDNECEQQYILAAMETIRSSFLVNSEVVSRVVKVGVPKIIPSSHSLRFQL